MREMREREIREGGERERVSHMGGVEREGNSFLYGNWLLLFCPINNGKHIYIERESRGGNEKRA